MIAGLYLSSRWHTRLYKEIGQRGGDNMLIWLEYFLYVFAKAHKKIVPVLELLELFFKS